MPWNFFSSYQTDKLINSVSRLDFRAYRKDLCIISDIDKTYLDTRFESIFKMVQIPFESAGRKLNIPGATELLHTLRWQEKDPAQLHFVSSSPPLLREVLEKKLAFDGLDWESDTFKNQSYNLLKGRFKLLKAHSAYKIFALLSILQNVKETGETNVILLGDSAEWDPFIFQFVRLFHDPSRVSDDFLREYLELGEIHKDDQDKIFKLYSRRVDLMVRVLIRIPPEFPKVEVPHFTDTYFSFDHYFELYVKLYLDGLLDAAHLEQLLILFHNRYGPVLDYLIDWLKALPPSDRCLQPVLESLESKRRPEFKGSLSQRFLDKKEMPLMSVAAIDPDPFLKAVAQWVEQVKQRK